MYLKNKKNILPNMSFKNYVIYNMGAFFTLYSYNDFPWGNTVDSSSNHFRMKISKFLKAGFDNVKFKHTLYDALSRLQNSTFRKVNDLGVKPFFLSKKKKKKKNSRSKLDSDHLILRIFIVDYHNLWSLIVFFLTKRI